MIGKLSIITLSICLSSFTLSVNADVALSRQSLQSLSNSTSTTSSGYIQSPNDELRSNTANVDQQHQQSSATLSSQTESNHSNIEEQAAAKVGSQSSVGDSDDATSTKRLEAVQSDNEQTKVKDDNEQVKCEVKPQIGPTADEPNALKSDQSRQSHQQQHQSQSPQSTLTSSTSSTPTSTSTEIQSKSGERYELSEVKTGQIPRFECLAIQFKQFVNNSADGLTFNFHNFDAKHLLKYVDVHYIISSSTHSSTQPSDDNTHSTVSTVPERVVGTQESGRASTTEMNTPINIKMKLMYQSVMSDDQQSSTDQSSSQSKAVQIFQHSIPMTSSNQLVTYNMTYSNDVDCTIGPFTCTVNKPIKEVEREVTVEGAVQPISRIIPIRNQTRPTSLVPVPVQRDVTPVQQTVEPIERKMIVVVQTQSEQLKKPHIMIVNQQPNQHKPTMQYQVQQPLMSEQTEQNQCECKCLPATTSEQQFTVQPIASQSMQHQYQQSSQAIRSNQRTITVRPVYTSLQSTTTNDKPQYNPNQDQQQFIRYYSPQQSSQRHQHQYMN